MDPALKIGGGGSLPSWDMALNNDLTAYVVGASFNIL